MSDYERLLADLREMNEHGMRDHDMSDFEASLNLQALTSLVMQRTDNKARWKVVMSEPSDPKQRFWIILEGKVPDA